MPTDSNKLEWYETQVVANLENSCYIIIDCMHECFPWRLQKGSGGGYSGEPKLLWQGQEKTLAEAKHEAALAWDWYRVRFPKGAWR